jgi:hypothetical protein
MSFRFGSRIAERNADNSSSNINNSSSNNNNNNNKHNNNNNNNTILAAGEVAVVPATLSLPGSQAAVLTRSKRPSVRHRLQLLPAPEATVYPLQLM